MLFLTQNNIAVADDVNVNDDDDDVDDENDENDENDVCTTNVDTQQIATYNRMNSITVYSTFGYHIFMHIHISNMMVTTIHFNKSTGRMQHP